MHNCVAWHGPYSLRQAIPLRARNAPPSRSLSMLRLLRCRWLFSLLYIGGLRVSEIAAVNLAALGLCCLATLYPAMLASRMRPVDGLRYE